ncbi:MAG TPA: low-specificity L-threonine aldolase [Bacteroidota bacterium]|nr:low-specificity L-threonine aldolase [Bacteroidota bacterium]
MHNIDLRSDTVTKPSVEMRAVMALADVGDDVYGEDPTVNRLEQKVSEMLHKEAALFVPSGVMSNQLALKCHTQPGDEVIVEEESHIFNFETAAAAFLSNVQLHTVKGDHGILHADQLPAAVRSSVYYNPITRLICLENTHNKAGGTIYPLEVIEQIHSFAREQNLALHLDGARLWNASVATGIAPCDYANYFDSVSVCFSKGLGAPVGSALVGSAEFIQRARKYRKIFGGGMRQVGILAAGALYALEHNIQRLAEDHQKAKLFAEAMGGIDGFMVHPETVQTNIVVIDIAQRNEPAVKILSVLKAQGILLSDMGRTVLRAVTHLGVSLDDVRHAAEMIQQILK